MAQCKYSHIIHSRNFWTRPNLQFIQVAIETFHFLLNISGLAFDDWDLDYYCDLFVNKIKRNPTSVECFDLAQSNRCYFSIKKISLKEVGREGGGG